MRPVREAVEADVPQLVEWGRRLFERARLPGWVSYDPTSMAATLRGMMAAETAAVLVGKHGFAAIMLTPSYFNHAILIGQKVCWWIEPGHLAWRHELFAAMERWSADRGAQAFFTAAGDGLNPRAIGRLYERAGYEPTDRTYMKRLS